MSLSSFFTKVMDKDMTILEALAPIYRMAQ